MSAPPRTARVEAPLRQHRARCSESRPNITHANRHRAERVGALAEWGVERPARLNLDALAARGVLQNDGYPNRRTRRVLRLLNAVAQELERLGPLLGEGGDAPVLGFYAYNQFMAPPMQVVDPGERVWLGTVEIDVGAIARDRGERCHPYLMPFLTGVRDTAEYASTGPVGVSHSLANPAGALANMLRRPDRFDLARWRTAASRVGYYEYHFGTNYLVPALYTTRLTNGIRWGAEGLGLRGYTSEVMPNWGLQAPMLWELAQSLYTPHTPVTALRREYCAAAFGAAAEAMTRYFDLCEEAWAATREVAEVVVLYVDAFPPGNAQWGSVGDSPTQVAAPEMESYAVRILEG